MSLPPIFRLQTAASEGILWSILISSDTLIGLFMIHALIIHLSLLLNILIQQGTPVGDKQAMWVVVSTRNTLYLTSCHQFSCQDAGPTFYPLTTIIGELHFVLVKLDAVTEDAEDSTRTHNVGIEALFLQGVCL